MSASIGCAINVYQDNWALPGLLENASAFFDDIYCIHAGPAGKKSTDGTIETLEKWGVKHVFADIHEGFGAIRSRLVHESSTEWVMIMDADERFMPMMPVLSCSGSEKYPDTPQPNLKVSVESPSYAQGKILRSLIENPEIDCIRALRRHWFDFTLTKPCENWIERRDWQCRILRNRPNIGFKPEEKMHEKVWDSARNAEPRMWRSDDPIRSIFYEHFHCHFKPMESDNNAEDAATYEALDKGVTAGMWLNQAAGVKV